MQNNSTTNGQSATNSASAATQQGHSETSNSKTYDAEAQRQAMEAGQAYVDAAPSGYKEELFDLGLMPGGVNHDKLLAQMRNGVPFAQAVQNISLEGQKQEKEKAEKLARTRNTMANLMESFRVATDMASAFGGGNVYKREGNEKIVAQNRADINAANEKYQRALDDFNNNMRNLKKEDLAERKRRMAQLGEVGFGTTSTTDNNSEQQQSQSSATATTQSGSQNQFLTDNVALEEQRARLNARYAAAASSKDNVTIRRGVMKNGKFEYQNAQQLSPKENDQFVNQTCLYLLKDENGIIDKIAANMQMPREEVVKILQSDYSTNKEGDGGKESAKYAKMKAAIAGEFWYQSPEADRWVSAQWPDLADKMSDQKQVAEVVPNSGVVVDNQPLRNLGTGGGGQGNQGFDTKFVNEVTTTNGKRSSINGF